MVDDSATSHTWETSSDQSETSAATIGQIRASDPEVEVDQTGGTVADTAPEGDRKGKGRALVNGKLSSPDDAKMLTKLQKLHQRQNQSQRIYLTARARLTLLNYERQWRQAGGVSRVSHQSIGQMLICSYPGTSL